MYKTKNIFLYKIYFCSKIKKFIIFYFSIKKIGVYILDQ